MNFKDMEKSTIKELKILNNRKIGEKTYKEMTNL